MLAVSYSLEVEYRQRKLEMTDEIRSCIKQAAHFLVDGSKFGLLLCGTPGNGKTTLMRAICSLISSAEVPCEGIDKTWELIYVSAKDIVRMAKQDERKFNWLSAQRAVAIDDLGEEPVEVLSYGNVLNPVIDFLSYRYDKQLLTIVTSNTPSAKIRERYGDRVADRFNEMMQVIIFTNPSFRKP